MWFEIVLFSLENERKKEHEIINKMHKRYDYSINFQFFICTQIHLAHPFNISTLFSIPKTITSHIKDDLMSKQQTIYTQRLENQMEE